MDPITKWFLLIWCGLAVAVAIIWAWQEFSWFKRMNKFVKGGE